MALPDQKLVVPRHYRHIGLRRPCTIIVLKIRIINSVSVITNCVIRKRDKKEKKSHLGLFLVNFAPKGRIPLSDFYKIERGRGSPRSSPSHQISTLWRSKLPKMVKIAPKGKSWKSIEKLKYRCSVHSCKSANLSLPLCNGTIIVSKVTLINNVSVSTDFVIRKHDKKGKKHHTIFW